jgi:hypothetical protein
MQKQKRPATITTILGRSGTGKSTSIRNLDPETTAIVSTDGKPLPFKGSGKFYVEYVDSGDPSVMWEALGNIKKKENIKTIVIDAWTQWHEAVSYHFTKKAESMVKPPFMYVANQYNNAIFTLWTGLAKMKDVNIFVFAHPSLGLSYDGTEIVVAKVDNQQRKGIVEERSTITLLTSVEEVDGKLEYHFVVRNTGGNSPVKAPDGMFEGATMPNDLTLVNKAIEDYYS